MLLLCSCCCCQRTSHSAAATAAATTTLFLLLFLWSVSAAALVLFLMLLLCCWPITAACQALTALEAMQCVATCNAPSNLCCYWCVQYWGCTRYLGHSMEEGCERQPKRGSGDWCVCRRHPHRADFDESSIMAESATALVSGATATVLAVVDGTEA